MPNSLIIFAIKVSIIIDVLDWHQRERSAQIFSEEFADLFDWTWPTNKSQTNTNCLPGSCSRLSENRRFHEVKTAGVCICGKNESNARKASAVPSPPAETSDNFVYRPHTVLFQRIELRLSPTGAAVGIF